MEIILKNKLDEAATDIDIKEGTIVSLQSNDIKTIVKNLNRDYSFTVIDNYNPFFLGLTVKEELDLFPNGYSDDFLAVLLEIFELEDKFLSRYINTLSHTEKVYLNILRNLLRYNNKVLFLDVFKFLDHKNKKKMILLLNYLKEKNYYIIITSADVNDLYSLSDYSIIWYKEIVDFGPTVDVYKEVEIFNKNRIPAPTLAEITYKAKKEKNVKLFYSRDVRDIIKDIYKHV